VILEERRFSPGNRHAAELMPALQDLCRQRNCEPAQIAQIYVSVGPGSFTGIRIAISVARALHLAIGATLIAVPTLQVIAQNAPPEVHDLIVMLDAKRGQVFAAQFKRAAHEWQMIRPARLIDPNSAIAEALADGLDRIHVMGEGLDYHRAALAGRADVLEVDKALWPPTAQAVHDLGWQTAAAGKFTPAAELLPVYIRLAEAEEVWRKKRGLPL
jgi:tRNA threonylcarbamoyladenosine biosynthesis protein TsaB